MKTIVRFLWWGRHSVVIDLYFHNMYVYFSLCSSALISLCVSVCVATLLLLVSAGHVDPGDWSVADDVIDTGEVEFVPVFQPTPRNVSVSLGDRAVLRCRVQNLGTRTVRSPFTELLLCSAVAGSRTRDLSVPNPTPEPLSHQATELGIKGGVMRYGNRPTITGRLLGLLRFMSGLDAPGRQSICSHRTARLLGLRGWSTAGRPICPGLTRTHSAAACGYWLIDPTTTIDLHGRDFWLLCTLSAACDWWGPLAYGCKEFFFRRKTD